MFLERVTAVLCFHSYCKSVVTDSKKAVGIASFFVIFHPYLYSNIYNIYTLAKGGEKMNKIVLIIAKTFTKGIDEIKTRVGFQVTYF